MRNAVKLKEYLELKQELDKLNDEATQIMNAVSGYSLRVQNREEKAEKLKGEAEAEYMRILAEAYNSAEKQEFYEFYRSLDALKLALSDGKKVVILPADSDIAKILMGN